MILAATYADPWRFEANPEVYLLVAFLIGAYVYSIRVLGPRAVPAGEQIVSRTQIGCFIAAMTLLFAASTWPIHQIAEEYLYSVHMLQHMMLSYFLPPLVLMATPEWLLRILIGDGRTYQVARFLTRPVVAAVIFNAMVIVTHIPAMVNASGTNPFLHYTLHFLLVFSALVMWMPVLGPFPELQMSSMGKPIYLFLQSVIPTVPAGWLAAAEGVVYKHYLNPVRVFGISPTFDQQWAGAIMKLGGAMFLWTMVIWYFFKRSDPDWEEGTRLRRRHATEAEELTYQQVTQEFDRSVPPVEEQLR